MAVLVLTTSSMLWMRCVFLQDCTKADFLLHKKAQPLIVDYRHKSDLLMYSLPINGSKELNLKNNLDCNAILNSELDMWI